MIALWPHQAAAAERIANNEIQALWWQMRCGKTLAAIAGTNDGDRLIVCPNSVKAVWRGDLQKYDQDSYIWNTNKFPKDRPRNVIINYESFWRTPLVRQNWDNIIFDESLRLQNPRTKLWKYISENMAHICKAKRVLLLSGTPCPEGFHQLVTQSIIATGQYCGITEPWDALRRYFVYNEEQYCWEIDRNHTTMALKQLHSLGPVITQAEAGINTKKLYRTMRIELSEHEIDLWDSIQEDLKNKPITTQMLYAQSVASGRPVQGHTTVSTKLDAVANYVIELNQPCVVLVHFTESLIYLQSKLKEKLRIGCIWGEDKGTKSRAELIQQFDRGEINCLICNVATVGRAHV